MPNEFIIKNGFRSQGNSEITGSLSTFATSSTATLLTLGASGSTSTTLTYTNRVPTLALTSNTNGPSSGGTGPDYLLTLNKVGSDGGPKVGIQISNAGVNSAILAYRAGAPSYLDMGFLIANNQILTLTSAQNVGIGTTSPSSKLHILGSGTTSATTALLVQNSGGTTTFLTRDDGVSVAYGQQLWVGKSDVGEIAFSNEASTFDKRFSIRFQTAVMYIQGTLGGDKGNMSIARDTSQVGFGRGIPDASAQVQIDSTTRGFILPRTNLTSNISTPAQGLMTYLTGSTNEGLYYYNSGSNIGWHKILSSTGSQAISGSLTVVGSSNLGGATFSNGGATFANNVNVAALNEGSGNSWVNLNTTRVHLGQNGSTGGLNVTAATQFVGVGKMATAQLDILGNTFLTGSLSITSSAGTGSAIYAYKSGSTVLDIQGSQGQLFSVVDALSGSLMSVNDVSGLPILEVFSDDRVVMGTYGAPALTVSGSAVTVATASSAPSGTVPEGTFRFATVGGAYYIYAFIGGAWRSGSLS